MIDQTSDAKQTALEEGCFLCIPPSNKNLKTGFYSRCQVLLSQYQRDPFQAGKGVREWFFKRLSAF
jgi:hypothetical protein